MTHVKRAVVVFENDDGTTQLYALAPADVDGEFMVVGRHWRRFEIRVQGDGQEVYFEPSVSADFWDEMGRGRDLPGS